jgi:uncharacterized protein (TIGR04222 family)
MDVNPFDLRGPQFLLFYFIFSVVVIAALVLLRRKLESTSAPKIDLSDPYLIAYLRGGKNEALRVALVSLIDRGLLIYDGTRIERASNAEPDQVRRPLDKALMEKFATPGEASTIFDDITLELACDPYQETLKRDRLLPDESVEQIRLVLTVVAFFILGGVGGIKVFIALERGRTNIIFLIILTVIAIVVAVKIMSPRLTSRGAALLADVQTLYAGLKERATFIRPGGATIEAMMLAAAFGIDTLAGDAFAYTKALFPRPQKAATGSSCGSSCGSSWDSSSGSSCGSSCGGGGGCGGCGGCGS